MKMAIFSTFNKLRNENRIPTHFDARPMRTGLQARLGHLHWVRFVVDGLAQQFDVLLDVEDLLLGLWKKIKL